MRKLLEDNKFMKVTFDKIEEVVEDITFIVLGSIKMYMNKYQVQKIRMMIGLQNKIRDKKFFQNQMNIIFD